MSDAGSSARSAASVVHRASVGGARISGRIFRAYRTLAFERRLAALASVLLFFTLFLPWYKATAVTTGHSKTSSVTVSITGWGAFSFVEAAVLLVAVGVMTLLFQRAEGRAFHLPGGDGWIVTIAGGWTCVLIVWRIFDKQSLSTHGELAVASGISWGIVVALGVATFLAYSGLRIRAAQVPEPPLPGEPGYQEPERPAKERRPKQKSGGDFYIPTPQTAANADDDATVALASDEEMTQVVDAAPPKQPARRGPRPINGPGANRPSPAAQGTRPGGLEPQRPAAQGARPGGLEPQRPAAQGARPGGLEPQRPAAQGPRSSGDPQRPPGRSSRTKRPPAPSGGPAKRPAGPAGPAGPPPAPPPRPGAKPPDQGGRRPASERRTGWLTARPKRPEDFPEDARDDLGDDATGELFEAHTPGTPPDRPRTKESLLGWSYGQDQDDQDPGGAGQEDRESGPDQGREEWDVSDFNYDRRVRTPIGGLGPTSEPGYDEGPADGEGPADDLDYYVDEPPPPAQPPIDRQRPAKQQSPPRPTPYDIDSSEDETMIAPSDPLEDETLVAPDRRSAPYDIDASEDETIVNPRRRRKRQE